MKATDFEAVEDSGWSSPRPLSDCASLTDRLAVCFRLAVVRVVAAPEVLAEGGQAPVLEDSPYSPEGRRVGTRSR